MTKLRFQVLKVLLITAFFGVTVQAKVYSDLDPQGEAAVELIAQDLQIDQASALSAPEIQTQFTKNHRDYYQLKFSHPLVNDIQILISGPEGFFNGSKKYPLLFISAGFLSGMASIDLIDNPGDFILVGFEYPTSLEKIKNDPSLLFKTIRVVPGQIALTLEWLRNQTYSGDKLSVMGVSLGSLFMPISLRLAGRRGVSASSTIFAFGGAHIIPVLEKMLASQLMSPLMMKLALSFAANITSLHDPKIHLAQLPGPFLCIYGDQDQLFPRESSLLQYQLLQDPKEISWVHGSHIDTDKPDVIKQTMDKVMDFLHRTDFFLNN